VEGSTRERTSRCRHLLPFLSLLRHPGTRTGEEMRGGGEEGGDEERVDEEEEEVGPLL
jgi:hypothetical protein